MELQKNSYACIAFITINVCCCIFLLLAPEIGLPLPRNAATRSTLRGESSVRTPFDVSGCPAPTCARRQTSTQGFFRPSSYSWTATHSLWLQNFEFRRFISFFSGARARAHTHTERERRKEKETFERCTHARTHPSTPAHTNDSAVRFYRNGPQPAQCGWRCSTSFA